MTVYFGAATFGAIAYPFFSDRALADLDTPATDPASFTKRHRHTMKSEHHFAEIITRANLGQKPMDQKVFAVSQVHQVLWRITPAKRPRPDVMPLSVYAERSLLGARNDGVVPSLIL